MLRRVDISTWLVVVVSTALVAGFFLSREIALVGHLGFPLDDAWIHLTFARNFADGLGFCFNPGEPVAGSTGPLWTAMLGLFIALFGASPGAVKALGLLLLIGAALMAVRVTRQLGADPVVAAFAGLLLVVTPRMQWAALSGMELMPAILLSLGGVSAYLHWRDGGRTVCCVVAGLLFGLSGWARPEALVLAGGPGIDLAARWVTSLREGDRGVKPLIPMLLLCSGFAVAAGPFFLFNHQLTGGASVLPSTFSAKTMGYSVFDRLAGGGAVLPVLLTPVKTIWPVIKYMLMPDNLLLALMLPALFFRGGPAVAASRPLWSALLLLPLLRALLTGEPANFQQFGRYLAVTTPFFLVLGTLAVQTAFGRRDRDRRATLPSLLVIAAASSGALGLFYYLKRSIFGMGHQWPQAGTQWYLPVLGQAGFLHVVIFGLVALLAAAAIHLGRRRLPARLALPVLLVLVLALSVSLVEDWQVATEYAWNVHNIDRTQVRIGQWLAEQTPADAVVATNDIGAIGFFSGRRVIDMVGLVTPGMLERLRRTRDRDGAILAHFREDRPDYVVIFDDWYPGIAARSDLLAERLRVPIENNLTCGSPGTRDMTVYHWIAGAGGRAAELPGPGVNR